jgi:hypothetical protein
LRLEDAENPPATAALIGDIREPQTLLQSVTDRREG